MTRVTWRKALRRGWDLPKDTLTHLNRFGASYGAKFARNNSFLGHKSFCANRYKCSATDIFSYHFDDVITFLNQQFI